MSENTKWTSWPWFVSHANASNYSVGIQSREGYQWHICDVCDDIHYVNYRANANLIAAAPELYEALDVLLNLHDAQVYVASPWNESMEKARNILAKARGEQ